MLAICRGIEESSIQTGPLGDEKMLDEAVVMEVE